MFIRKEIIDKLATSVLTNFLKHYFVYFHRVLMNDYTFLDCFNPTFAG
jgi:hypothetical protein